MKSQHTLMCRKSAQEMTVLLTRLSDNIEKFSSTGVPEALTIKAESTVCVTLRQWKTAPSKWP